jgi:hypothetical protein
MTAIQGVHPYADKFPMLPESELEELAESIKQNGQRQPIVLTEDGLILDGRNRTKACEMVNVEPEVTVYEGDDLAEFVVDSNISRRHMTTGARAMATALVMQESGARRYNDEGIGYWRRGSVLILGNQNNESNWRFVLSQAGVVLDYKPDLANKVVDGDMTLEAAFDQANAIKQSAERDKILERERRKREREEAAAEAERNSQIVADLTQAGASYYLEQIENGHMKPVSAWAAYQAEHQKELDRQAAERRNDEKRVRFVGDMLENVSFLEVPEQRERYIAAVAKYPDALISRQSELHTPQRIRQLADVLLSYAKELEETPC